MIYSALFIPPFQEGRAVLRSAICHLLIIKPPELAVKNGPFESTLAWYSNSFMNVLKWMIEILQKNLLFVQNVHKLMQRNIFYQLTNSTPHFLQRGILEIFSAVFWKNRKIFNLHIGIKVFMKSYLNLHKEGRRWGHGLSAAIKLGNPEPKFLQSGCKLTCSQ